MVGLFGHPYGVFTIYLTYLNDLVGDLFAHLKTHTTPHSATSLLFTTLSFPF